MNPRLAYDQNPKRDTPVHTEISAARRAAAAAAADALPLLLLRLALLPLQPQLLLKGTPACQA